MRFDEEQKQQLMDAIEEVTRIWDLYFTHLADENAIEAEDHLVNFSRIAAKL